MRVDSYIKERDLISTHREGKVVWTWPLETEGVQVSLDRVRDTFVTNH